MPRTKRNVFVLFCADPECPHTGNRLGAIRLFKQDKKGKGWKEHIADMRKYCKFARKRVAVKGKEERHSAK